MIATLVVGGFVAAGLWIAQHLGRLGSWRFVIVLISGTCGVLLILASSTDHFLGEQAWYNRPIWKGCFECILMILGMLASVLNTAIKARQLAKANLGGAALPPLQIDRYDLVQPLLFSLVTFAALYAQIGTQDLSVANIAFCFQTGFMWQSVVGKIK